MVTCLYVSRYLYPFTGGAERSTRVLLKALVEHGFTCQAICYAPSDHSLQVDGISITLTPDPIRRMREAVARRPSVVLTQLALAAETIEYASQLGIPTILRVPSWEHFCNAPGTFTTCGWSCIHSKCNHRANYTPMFQKVTVVVAISNFVASAVMKFYGRECIVVYPPVERSQYEVASRSERYITMVRGHALKGAGLFINLAGQMPDERFLLCGISDPHIVAAAQAHPNINCCWQKADMREVYSQTVIYLAPVVWAEPFGRTLIEAMINGIPVIGTKQGALPEVLDKAGIVLPPDPKRWKKTVLRLLNDRDYYKVISDRCLHRSFDFDADVQKKAFVDLVSGLVN